MEIGAPRSLLVLKPSSFGDIVHTLPAVARLKAAWPDCRISWLANTEWMPLLNGNPAVDEVIDFPRREFRGWGGGWQMAKWLQTTMAGRRPDLAVDFQGLLRSALVGRASGAGVLAGSSDAREGARWLYRRTVPAPRQPVHAVVRYLALADAVLSGRQPGHSVGSAGTEVFWLPDGERPEAGTTLEDGYVLVHPYARGNDKSLSYSDIKRFIRLIRNKQIVLVGLGDPGVVAPDSPVLNLMNKTTLAELIWLTRRASFVVSVDSGPAHLAAALGRPMVAIHSWSDPRKVGPYRPDAWVWKNGRLTQVCSLPAMNAAFFVPKPLRLEAKDLSAIAALATSPSDFCA